MDKRKVKWGSFATVFRGNNRYAAKVVDVVTYKEVVVRRLVGYCTDFINNKWTYDDEFSTDHPEPLHFTLRKNGNWVEKGMDMNHPDADILTIGYAHHYVE